MSCFNPVIFTLSWTTLFLDLNISKQYVDERECQDVIHKLSKSRTDWWPSHMNGSSVDWMLHISCMKQRYLHKLCLHCLSINYDNPVMDRLSPQWAGAVSLPLPLLSHPSKAKNLFNRYLRTWDRRDRWQPTLPLSPSPFRPGDWCCGQFSIFLEQKIIKSQI